MFVRAIKVYNFDAVTNRFEKYGIERYLNEDLSLNELNDKQKQLILFYHSSLCHLEIVKRLVEENGVNIHAVDEETGGNCFHFSIPHANLNGCIDFTNYLISKGVNVNLSDKQSFTPLEWHIIAYLEQLENWIDTSRNKEDIIALFNAGAEFRDQGIDTSSDFHAWKTISLNAPHLLPTLKNAIEFLFSDQLKLTIHKNGDDYIIYRMQDKNGLSLKTYLEKEIEIEFKSHQKTNLLIGMSLFKNVTQFSDELKAVGNVFTKHLHNYLSLSDIAHASSASAIREKEAVMNSKFLKEVRDEVTEQVNSSFKKT